MGDINWLYLARTPYWEEKDPGRRFSILRKIKNNTTEYRSQYTLEAIAARLPDYPVKRLREIELGVVTRPNSNETPMEVLRPLFTDLGMTEPEFLTTIKLKRGGTPTTTQPQPIQEKKPVIEAKPVVVTTAKPIQSAVCTQPPKIPQSSQLRDMKIISHLQSAIVLVFEKDKIHIYDDSPESADILKKPAAKWIGPADQVGNRVIEREFDLKGIKGL